jgi:hypothetical protein
VFIPLAVVVALLGLSMCRLAALSDNSHAAALAEWVATAHLDGLDRSSDESPREQFPFDSRGASYRAAG